MNKPYKVLSDMYDKLNEAAGLDGGAPGAGTGIENEQHGPTEEVVVPAEKDLDTLLRLVDHNFVNKLEITTRHGQVIPIAEIYARDGKMTIVLGV